MTDVQNLQDATVTLDQLVDESHGYDEHKQDWRVNATDLFFDGEFGLHVPGVPLGHKDGFVHNPKTAEAPANAPLRLSDNALSQLYSKLGPPHFGRGSSKILPNDFLDALGNEDRGQVLNWIMAKAKASKWLVRSYDDTCRAILDTDYPRVWNTDLLGIVRDALVEMKLNDQSRLVRPFVSADALGVKIMWPDLGPNDGNGHLRVGILIRNGETGANKLEGLPFVQDGRCNNSIVTDSKKIAGGAGLSITHYAGASASSLMIQFASKLPAIMNASSEMINTFIEAERVNLPDFRAVVDGLAIQYGWKTNQEIVEMIDEGSRQSGRSIGGIVSGITFAAQHAHNLSEAQRIDLETVGGNYLYEPASEFARLARQGREQRKVAHA